MSNKHFIGKRLFSFSDNGLRDPVSRVTLLVDTENAVTAGDDTGLELVANCPYADETLAKALLNQVKGYQYRAFEAQSVVLDPAAELGDGITAERVYSILAGMTDKGDGYPDITAPGNREEADEYPEGGPMTRLFNRELANARSLITKTSESIRLEVSSLEKKTGEELAELEQYVNSENEKVLESTLEKYAALEVSLDGISGRVESLESVTTTQGTTITSLQTELNAVPGKISASVSKSEQYTNTKYSDATKYADNAAAGAKTYADGKADEVLELSLERSAELQVSLDGISGRVESLESVTTTQGTTITSLQTELNAVPGKISASVSKSEQYTNTKYSDATKYADNAAAGAKTYADGKADEVLRTSLDRSAALEVSLDGISGRVESLETVTTTQGTSITSLQTDLNAVPGKISARVSELKEYTDGEFATVSDQYTALELTVDNLSMKVVNTDGVETSVKLSDGKIDLSGLVTFSSLSSTPGNGVTKINGGWIDAETLNLSKRITFNDLSSAVQNDINDAYSMAEDAEAAAADAADTVDAWRYDGGTYIDGSMVMAGTVIAGSLIGGTVGLLTSREREAGGIDITGSSSSTYAIELWSEAALRLCAYGNYASVYLEADESAALGIQTVGSLGYNVTVNRSLIPSDDGLYCGRASYKWEAVYAETETIQTSDMNKKTDIEDLPEKYIAMFDLLTPKRARMINGTSGRYHPCYIAQDVKAAMDAVGIDSLEFGGWVKDFDENGNEIYMLRYGEFDPIRDAKIKQLEARLARLEETK